MYAHYQALLKACNAVDFNDLLGHVVALLDSHEGCAQRSSPGTASLLVVRHICCWGAKRTAVKILANILTTHNSRLSASLVLMQLQNLFMLGDTPGGMLLTSGLLRCCCCRCSILKQQQHLRPYLLVDEYQDCNMQQVSATALHHLKLQQLSLQPQHSLACAV